MDSAGAAAANAGLVGGHGDAIARESELRMGSSVARGCHGASGPTVGAKCTLGRSDAGVRSRCGAGSAAGFARRAATPGDRSFGAAGAAAATTVTCSEPPPVASGVFASLDERTWLEALACRRTPTLPAFASPEEAVASTAASPTGVEASTAADAGASVGDESTVTSPEVDGVETSMLAPASSVETSASTDADPASTETETPGFFGCSKPAAAICASTASATRAMTTRATSARISPR
jgi:hypothetical protein